MQQIAVKSNAKGEFHSHKKGEVKGKRLFVKLKRAKGEMSQKQREKGKGAKGNIKKVRKSLLKQTDIEKERVLPQKDSE